MLKFLTGPFYKAYCARFTVTMKNIWDVMCMKMAFNPVCGSRLIVET